MRSTHYFLVEADSTYNNYDESGLAINVTIESVEHINRVATVVDPVEGSILEVGDKVLLHHNILRENWDMKGEKYKGRFHIKDNIYFVPATEVLMYSRGGGDWQAIDPYCFVKPIDAEEIDVSGFVMIEDNYKGKKKNQGVLWYPNKYQESKGLKRGDVVIYEDYCEHEYDIDGELMYKMKTQNVLGVLDEGSI